MRQPRRGKLGDRQTCRGGGGARRTDTGAEAVGVRQEERATSRRRLSKGKPAIWGPSFPPLPSPQAPPAPVSLSALPSAGAGSGCAPCGRAAGLGTNSLFVARRRRSTARRVTTSARARGGARRRRPSRLLTLPGNRRGAVGQRRPTVRFLKGAGTFYRFGLLPGGWTEVFTGK